ncbi:MAG TPA: N-acetylglucosamine-6-phosphate deacetylase [Bacilli bacterium]|jgi:N-acetylglucosamine-6-phosphate deacetylase|nr:N-acetylglucosamine-6-phosphate deacetylase [Bacilli bacterium]NLT01027.1 N-acetylglucosamine-6-phosphate deacetylase [Acholeplasmataceae bacterium]HNZ78261.1 N-acetylglucosamine-6-phosphate deacetylase [Bacilli bacterium]HOE06411.1 N-acetylglucosamine-6-phosphate deacetylase [Bacilli bacterium]HOH61433.1 N-acetylglucosamine-6-phosphate deacetylase [Bacilli bacterium]
MKGFKNANIYIEGKGIVKSSLVIENGKIASFDETKDLMTLREDLIVVPGFIDKHIHGANHSDAMYPSLEDIKNISKTIAREGVTSYMPTTMTQSEENIDKALKNIKEYIEKKNKDGAFVLGTHLEGPFISPKFKGAQPEQYIVPCSVEKFMHYQAVSGNNIKQVTLAYEENGKDLCNYLLSQGIVASIGHTNATALEVLEAAKNGVTSATHTYNAMKPLHHREAGTVGGVMLADTIYAELIADLVHVSPEAIKVLCKIKGLDKIVLVTDGIESKHLPDGTYSLGGQEVTVKGREARLADGTLAGSTLKMNQAIKNIKNVLGINLEKAIDLATINPARNLRIDHIKGSIALGKHADLTVIDKDLNVYMTISKGNIIYNSIY